MPKTTKNAAGPKTARKTKPTSESAVAKRLQAKLDAAKGKPAEAAPNGTAQAPESETALQAIAAEHGFTWDGNAEAAFRAAFAAGQAAKPARRPRQGGGKREMVAKMLQGEDGATTREILNATGWPAVSVPAIARASKLELRTEKRDGATVYYGSPA